MEMGPVGLRSRHGTEASSGAERSPKVPDMSGNREGGTQGHYFDIINNL